MPERTGQMAVPPAIVNRPWDIRRAPRAGAKPGVRRAAAFGSVSRGGKVVNLAGLLKTATVNDKARERLGDATIESP